MSDKQIVEMAILLRMAARRLPAECSIRKKIGEYMVANNLNGKFLRDGEIITPPNGTITRGE